MRGFVDHAAVVVVAVGEEPKHEKHKRPFLLMAARARTL